MNWKDAMRSCNILRYLPSGIELSPDLDPNPGLRNEKESQPLGQITFHICTDSASYKPAARLRLLTDQQLNTPQTEHVAGFA